MARPTAKSAIERLVAAGLLQRGPHKSARVPALGVNEIRDMYFARGCLEAVAVRHIARKGSPPQGAREAIADLTVATDLGEVGALVEPDIRFHREIVDALQSERMTRMHETLMGEMRLCMAQVQAHRLLPPAEIVAEHASILARLDDRDPVGAVAMVEAHLSRACALLVGHLGDAGARTGLRVDRE